MHAFDPTRLKCKSENILVNQSESASFMPMGRFRVRLLKITCNTFERE